MSCCGYSKSSFVFQLISFTLPPQSLPEFMGLLALLLLLPPQSPSHSSRIFHRHNCSLLTPDCASRMRLWEASCWRSSKPITRNDPRLATLSPRPCPPPQPPTSPTHQPPHSTRLLRPSDAFAQLSSIIHLEPVLMWIMYQLPVTATLSLSLGGRVSACGILRDLDLYIVTT